MRQRLIRILVVDDDCSARLLHSRLLRQMGYEVDTASDGLEALQLVERQTFDAIISDLEMPHLDGFDLAREVAHRPSTARPRLLAITANEGVEVGGEAMGAGFDGVLRKPISWDRLQGAMEYLEELARALS